MNNQKRLTAVLPITALALLGTSAALADTFAPQNIVVSRTVYTGVASTVTVGQALPGGGTAVADGTYPNVFQNEGPDPSFGVTSPVFLDQYSISGGTATRVSTVAVPSAQLVTSFSSKSELALNRSTDGRYLTFMGYVAAPNTLDVSNANTPNHVDPTDPVALTFQRAVVQVDVSGNVQVTPVNAYSGNNGRAAILDSANNQYFLVGNAGNGTGTEPATVVGNTGVQITTPGGSAETTVVGVQQGTSGSANGFQFGYSVVQNGFAADKSGKDDNFRGVALYGNTLYVTKGSGSNGINTVYQVGAAGTLPTPATAATTAINILPGFSTVLARSTGGDGGTSVPMNPFGIWFADANTLYVADEGDGKAANAATNVNAGLQKWVLEGDGLWHNVYTLQNGLNLGTQYSVPGLPSSLNPATDGLRALTGKVNGDGTVTLYAVTSTVSANVDQGADPNMLVTISDTISFMTAAAASGEQFTSLQTAAAGEVLRGVSRAPVNPSSAVPVPRGAVVSLGLLLLALGIGASVVGQKNRDGAALA